MPEIRVALAVMAKAPNPGEAKTRLALGVGSATAVALYRAFLLDSLTVIAEAAPRLGVTTKLVVCPDARHAEQIQSNVDAGWQVIAQHRRGLMGGLVDAFDAAFAAGADVALAVDADSPLTLFEHLEQCVALASNNDVAIGPTVDGGYYLIASRRAVRQGIADVLLGGVFESSSICAATIDRARALGLMVGVGPTGFDVDTVDELTALAERLRAFPIDVVPCTRGALAALESNITVPGQITAFDQELSRQ